MTGLLKSQKRDPSMKDVSNGFASDQVPQPACRIMISCTQPNVDGKMDVEMSYEGDPTLASYLLERAQTYIEQNEEWNLC
jgi:hypothetical protein